MRARAANLAAIPRAAAATLRNNRPSFAERVVIVKNSFLRLYLYLVRGLIEGLQRAQMAADAGSGQA
jgi:hypothetical protein